MRIKELTPAAHEIAARLRTNGRWVHTFRCERLTARSDYHHARKALVDARAELSQGDRTVEIGRNHPAHLHLSSGWHLLSKVVPALEAACADAERSLAVVERNLATTREARENTRAELARANFRPVSRGEQVARELANRDSRALRERKALSQMADLASAKRELGQSKAWAGPDGRPLPVIPLGGTFLGFPTLRWGGLTLAVLEAPNNYRQGLTLAPIIRDPELGGARCLGPGCLNAQMLGHALKLGRRDRKHDYLLPRQARTLARSAQAAD